MFKEIWRIRNVIILVVLIGIIFLNINYSSFGTKRVMASLVVFGDNTSTDRDPFIENNEIYMPVDVISKTIDENIYYDKIASKVIITTYSDVVKFKIGEKKISKNLEYSDIANEAKIVNGEPFIPISYVKDIYNITAEYNKDTNTVTVDKKDVGTATLKYNKVIVYSNISTDSSVLATLNKGATVIPYTDSLKHVRWLKIKTQDGIVGYVNKTSVDVVENNKNNQNNNTSNTSNAKINMFWQYGNDLNVLGKSKIEGVNVVSPTWFELKNSNGEISSKYNQDYYNQAKNLGYKIWPVITNGIDSVSYSPDDTSAMLNSEYNRELFIKNILETVEKYKLDGINIDFESMKTEDRGIYTEFIREFAPLLRQKGKTLTVDMYFVAYVDRAGVGKASDFVILMGYDQRGNWSSESGSISEISWVESNISSLINDSKISPEKIILGIPFYTRLWTEKVGSTKPTSVIYSVKDCQAYLNDKRLTPVWDEDAGQNYVELKTGDLTYKLWIEDTASVKKRIETVNKYNLAGVSAWKKGLETSDIWKTINDNLKK